MVFYFSNWKVSDFFNLFLVKITLSFLYALWLARLVGRQNLPKNVDSEYRGKISKKFKCLHHEMKTRRPTKRTSTKSIKVIRVNFFNAIHRNKDAIHDCRRRRGRVVHAVANLTAKRCSRPVKCIRDYSNNFVILKSVLKLQLAALDSTPSSANMNGVGRWANPIIFHLSISIQMAPM